MNCCCSSNECRLNGCQANKQNPYAHQNGITGLGGGHYQAYAPLTGAMNRLAAAIEAYNAERAKRDPT